MLEKLRTFIWSRLGITTTLAAYNGVKFLSSTSDCPWLKYKGFSFGDFGYAMDALALHNLFRILNDVKPKNILEFGLGQSSKMVYQYAEFYKANAMTVENDNDWINYVKASTPQINFNIRQAELETVKVNGAKTLSYKNIEKIAEEVNECSLIIVDGPSGVGQTRYSRSQVLNFVPQKLAKDFCIFIHDSERRGEQGTLNLLCKKLSRSGIEFSRKDYFRSVKWHTVVCSKSWRFLASI